MRRLLAGPPSSRRAVCDVRWEPRPRKSRSDPPKLFHRKINPQVVTSNLYSKLSKKHTLELMHPQDPTRKPEAENRKPRAESRNLKANSQKPDAQRRRLIPPPNPDSLTETPQPPRLFKRPSGPQPRHDPCRYGRIRPYRRTGRTGPQLRDNRKRTTEETSPWRK